MASHPPRLQNFDYIGRHYYFLTFCTHQRRPLFMAAPIIELLSRHLLRSSIDYDVAVDVYCVMPDHLHLLAKGLTDASDLPAFMRHFKQRTGWIYRQQKGERLWQGSYYDHVLRDEEGIDGVIAYIVNNPVRAGLAAVPEGYPFWDSFTQTRQGLLEFMKGAGEWKPSQGIKP